MKRKKAQVVRGSKSNQQLTVLLKRDWRLALLFAGFVVLAIILVLFVTGVLPPTRKLTDGDVVILRHYELIRSKLAEDDIAGAREAAAELAAASNKREPVFSAAMSLAKSDSLQSARMDFRPLSIVAVELADRQHGYYVMHCELYRCLEQCHDCPMDKFGEWVQVDPNVENPFMGKENIHCGVIKQ